MVYVNASCKRFAKFMRVVCSFYDCISSGSVSGHDTFTHPFWEGPPTRIH